MTKREVLALCGLRLPLQALRRLQQSGIQAEPAISIEYQSLSRQYVIRGTESGGAVAHFGAYVGYAGMDGHSLPALQQVQSVARNGRHAVVVAAELVRIQVFRVKQTCDLLITRHRLKPVERRARPVLENTILFHGTQGSLPADPANGGLTAAFTGPRFHTRSGELMAIPEQFHDAMVRACIGASCVGCSHVHVLAIPDLSQPSRNGADL
jgi:hypothetical protein